MRTKRFLLKEKTDLVSNAFEYISKNPRIKQSYFVDKNKMVFMVQDESWRHPVVFVCIYNSDEINLEGAKKIKINTSIKIPDLEGSFKSVEVIFRQIGFLDETQDKIMFETTYVIDTKELLNSLIGEDFDLKFQKQIDFFEKNLYRL